MAMFIALRLIDGTFKYRKIFGFKRFLVYKEDTDTILVAEGRQDLIEEL